MPVMKLSEAMRLGATMKAQAFHSFFKSAWVEEGSVLRSVVVSSCALGAALDAIGIHSVPKIADIPWPEEWRAALNQGYCPACERDLHGDRSVGAVFTHLNDTHGWTREKIADYIELHCEPLPAAKTWRQAVLEEIESTIPIEQQWWRG